MNEDWYGRPGGLHTRTDKDLRQYPWYYGAMSRSEAENHLLREGRQEGTFLIRDASPGTVADPFRLSVLEWRNGACKVVHYKVEVNILGKYYLDPLKTFPTLERLVSYYRDYATEMKTRLSSACSRGNRTNISGLEISRDKLAFVEKISSHRDKLTEVWKAKLHDLRETQVAVKKQNNGGQEAGERLLDEASALRILNHDNITRILGVVTSYPVCVVMEFQTNLDMLDFLLKIDCYETAYPTLLLMARQVASALQHVGGMMFVHRNVRANNILVDNNLQCKLSGFSFARSVNEHGYYFTTDDDPPFDPQMYRWMAIEGAVERRFSTASDVWSFAVFLHELYTKGEMPYADVLAPHVVNAVSGGIRLQQDGSIPASVYSIMTKCWTQKPEHRPDFAYIIGYFETLYNQTQQPRALKLSPGTQEYPRYVKKVEPRMWGPR